MKKVLSIIVTSLLFITMLFGCASTNQSPSTTIPSSTTIPTTPVPTTVPPTTLPPAPVYVYEKATENFLLPLDEYSWARQYPVEYVMLHFSSAVVNHPDDPYNMDYIRDTFVQYNVSTHYIIDREGNVECYIPEDRAAWHAGRGTWLDDEKYTNKMNYYAIGIELAGMGSAEDMSIYMSKAAYNALPDSYKCFTDQQYDALKLLVADLCGRYDLPMDREHIIGHSDFNPAKVDPGQLFDWDRLLSK